MRENTEKRSKQSTSCIAPSIDGHQRPIMKFLTIYLMLFELERTGKREKA